MRNRLIIHCAVGALALSLNGLLFAQETAPTPTAQSEETPVFPADAEPGNVYCPVSPDETVDLNFYSMYEGKKVYLCCKRCRTKFEADPAAYVANLPPTLTPVSLKESSGDQHAEEAEHSHAEADTPAEDHDASEAHEHDEAAGAGEEAHEHDEAAGAGEEEHDHSAHADQEASTLTKTLSFIGRFHVIAIHFPIALLSVGALFEFFSMFGGGDKARSVVRACIAIGALSAVGAATLGLMNAIGADYNGVLNDVFWWHRLLGLTTAGLAIAAWAAVEWRRMKPSSKTMLAARGAVFLTAAFVAITEHLGGSLVFGWEYLIP
jgi:uncharacterized membrane protein/YHS domain-containing protein